MQKGSDEMEYANMRLGKFLARPNRFIAHIEIDGKKYIIDTSYGLGNVWYSHLIPTIIKSGVNYTV